jgi:hypothetical protein
MPVLSSRLQSVSLDLVALLGFGILGLVFVAFEIAGLTLPGMHTVSYLAHGYMPLRLLILVLFALATIWWWQHSGTEVPR